MPSGLRATSRKRIVSSTMALALPVGLAVAGLDVLDPHRAGAEDVVGSVANQAAPSKGTTSRSRRETSSNSSWSLVALPHASLSSPSLRSGRRGLALTALPSHGSSPARATDRFSTGPRALGNPSSVGGRHWSGPPLTWGVGTPESDSCSVGWATRSYLAEAGRHSMNPDTTSPERTPAMTTSAPRPQAAPSPTFRDAPPVVPAAPPTRWTPSPPTSTAPSSAPATRLGRGPGRLAPRRRPAPGRRRRRRDRSATWSPS